MINGFEASVYFHIIQFYDRAFMTTTTVLPAKALPHPSP